MGGKKILSACEDAIDKIVSDLGYYLVAVEYKKQISGMVLEVIIDSENGINLNDCEKVSKALDQPLDELDPTNGESYNLNVSSMGLDRPITTEYQLNKYKGKEVEAKFYEPLKPYNKKTLIGKLNCWDEQSITLAIGQEESLVSIPKKIIAILVPYVKF